MLFSQVFFFEFVSFKKLGPSEIEKHNFLLLFLYVENDKLVRKKAKRCNMDKCKSTGEEEGSNFRH